MNRRAFQLSAGAFERVRRCIRGFAAASKHPVRAALIPSRTQLARVVEAVHWASVIADEGRLPRFSVSFGPPDAKDEPIRVKSLALTPGNLAALAPAALKDTCQIGVSANGRRLEIWGLHVGHTT